MFFQSREETMEGIAARGSASCCYAPGALDVEAWKAGAMCDCKYGIKREDIGRPFANSEQTGCPELRSVYKVLAAMTDNEWDDLVARAGGIQTHKLFAKTEEYKEGSVIDEALSVITDDQMGVWL